MERQQNIEIFILNCPFERIVQWVEAQIGALGEGKHIGAPDGSPSLLYEGSVGQVILSVTLGHEHPSDIPFEGYYTSVYFPHANSPWATDVDCGRQAARELSSFVMCDPGQHYPEVPALSDTFLEIAPDGAERLMEW